MSLTKKYSQHTVNGKAKKKVLTYRPKKLQAEIDRLEETLTRTIGTLYLIAELHPDVSVIALNCILRIKTALRY